MRLTSRLGKFAGEAARAIRNFKYDRTPTGIYIPGARASVGGIFRHALMPRGESSFLPWVLDPNRMVNESLNYMLNAAFGGGSQVTAYYLAPYSGNVTPAAGWTGANFTANATEFTAYTPSTRLPWTTVASTAQAIGNSAALAAATATFTGTGPYTLYGIGLLEASAKSATTGMCVAATRFATARANLVAGDKLAFEYVITAIDEGDLP